ncbi:MAG: 50S ribosomal protein L9 [Planctomycetota bacterium]
MAVNIELLLIENVEALGIVGDVVKVRTGYARNFLLPRNLATQPSPEKIKALAGKRAEAETMLAEQRRQRKELAGKLQGVEVTLIRSCNDQGILYGSITQQDIATALLALGHGVKPRDIRISQVMKRVDTFDVHVKLDSDLDSIIKVIVQPDRKLELERHEAEAKETKKPAHAEQAEEGAEQAAPAEGTEAKGEAKSEGKPAAKGGAAEGKDAEKKPKVKKDRPEKSEKDGKSTKEADAAAAAAAKSVWGKPIDDSAKNLIPAARPRRERR